MEGPWKRAPGGVGGVALISCIAIVLRALTQTLFVSETERTSPIERTHGLGIQKTYENICCETRTRFRRFGVKKPS